MTENREKSESIPETEVEEPKFNDLWAFNCLLGLVVATGQLVTVIWPYWIETDYHSSSDLLGNVHIFKGLWTKCLTRHVAQWQCSYYEYSDEFKLESIRGLRLTACLGTLLSWIGWVLSFYGSEFIKRKLKPDTYFEIFKNTKIFLVLIFRKGYFR